MAHVMQQLGSEHVLVVHADDGLDEISIGAPTQVAELHNGSVSVYRVEPADFGLATADLTNIAAADAADSLRLINSVLDGEAGPARDIVVLNAGAAIYVAGLAANLAEGVTQAAMVIESGKAKQTLLSLVDVSNSV